METEIELKFFVSTSFLPLLKETIGGFNILQQSQRQLHNTYFDTEDFLLRNHDMGLRVRRFEDACVQTLKTSGRVVAGLYHRPEYNAPLSSEMIDISLIPEDAWPQQLEIKQLSADLLPLFSTSFMRHQWLIAMPDSSQIELAFDLGQVSKNEKHDTICEVEIELKSGQIDALFILAQALAKKGGMRLGNLSKAAKGYRLVTDYQGDAIKHLSVVSVTRSYTIEQGFTKALEHALEHWHYHEQIYVERQDPEALVEISYSLTLLLQAFSIYGKLIPERASTLLREELQWLEGEFAWVSEAFSINRLCEDKAYFLRKLNAKKQLCVKLNAYLETLPAPDQMINLFHSTRYCSLLLNLSRWLLIRGWQPFLDASAHEMLNQPLIDYSNQILAESWAHLLSDFSLSETFDRFTYIEKQANLTKNLLSGCCLGALYNIEEREPFRLPWLDLLRGIEYLGLLEPIRSLLVDDDINDEEKAQMEKWLARKEESLLYAMLQSRQTGLELAPYWDA